MPATKSFPTFINATITKMDIEEDKPYIEIGEQPLTYKFYLPTQPPDKEILFYKEKPKEQYWRREKVVSDLPDYFFKWNKDVTEDSQTTQWTGRTLTHLSKEDTENLIRLRDREIGRILNGIWFFNNGVPTYITGGHYFALTWAAMFDSLNTVEEKSIYGSYMRFQRDYCYFIEIIKTTPHASGGNACKPKKTGITMLQTLLFLADAITHKAGWYRMMSTSEEDAKKTNFRYLTYALEKLPPILTPEYTRNLGALHFENSDVASRRSSRKRTDAEFLDSHIETVPTVVNAFDSGKNKGVWIDEQSKIEIDTKNNITTLHNITLATVKQGFLRTGYIIYTHYVSERNNDSYKRAKTIFYDSFMKTIDPSTKKTKSELLAYAMFAQHGTFGACDKYGEPQKDIIWNEINANINSRKNDPAALLAYKRQYPTCLDDMWQEGAGEDAVFDNLRLGKQLHQITEDNDFGAYQYKEFNFSWTAQPEIDEIRGIYKFPAAPKTVFLTDDQKKKGEVGLFKWYMPEWTPKTFIEQNTQKIYRDAKGRLRPNPQCPFYASIDPTQYSNAKEVVVASKNAMQVFILPNAELDGLMNKKVTFKRLMVEYLHRPDSPRDTLMHVVQTILYFGCYVLVECNANWLYTRLKEWGFANFLIVVNKETGVLEPYKEYADQKPFTSQKSERGSADTIGEYVIAGRNHLADDINGIDNIPFIYSRDVLTQLMNFTPDNTRSYDAAVCYLIGLMGINTFLGWKQRQLDKTNKKADPVLRHFLLGVSN